MGNRSNSPTAYQFFNDDRYICVLSACWAIQLEIREESWTLGSIIVELCCHRDYARDYERWRTLLCSTSTRYTPALHGADRLLTRHEGISVGWFLTFSQLYVHEVAPAHLRGITFAVYQCQLSIGSITGAAVDFGTKDIDGRQAYQIPLAVFFAAPLIQSIAMIFFPETPRWLMVHGKEEKAERSLRKLRNSNINELEFQAELNEIRQSTREQLEQNKKALFLEMWRGTNLRRTLLSIAVVCFHCANGTLRRQILRISKC